MPKNMQRLFFVSLLACPCALAGTSPPGGSATVVLAQLAQAFSQGNAVNQVTLNGNAAWTVGGLTDSGAVALSASSSGTAQMQLNLSASGTRTESQSGFGSAMNCQWTDANGNSHDVDLGNCWRPAIPFLPAFSLQQALIPSSVGIVDLGMSPVGAASTLYRHLEAQFVFGNMPAALSAQMMQRSTTDIGLDPNSFLPSILTYQVTPDAGSLNPVSIEIRYSQYTAVSGVQIPFRIQRYVNGSIQIDITISSAQIN